MENKSVIYTVEPLCVGIEHSQINERFLRMLLQIKGVRSIRFYGEGQHIQNVLQRLTNTESSKIEGFEFKISLLKLPHKFILSVYKISKFAFESRRSEMPLLILSCNKYLLLIIKIASFISRKKVLIVLHGFIGELKYNSSKNFDLKWLMKCGKNWVQFFYLSHGQFVHQNLVRKVPEISDNTFSINLPINKIEKNFVVNKKKPREITMGCAGVACRTKGSENFFMMANTLQLNNKIRFVYIGTVVRLTRGFLDKYGNNIIIYRDELSDHEYEKLFSEIDFLVFFYPSDAYDYGFSGVFLDAIRFCKPIIALKNNLFAFYFKKYGELGWLFDTIQELEAFIADISKVSVDVGYKTALANLEKARSQFHTEIVAAKMSKILKEICKGG